MNPDRHMSSHYDYFRNLIKGDDTSTEAHRKFYDEYNAVLDMDADYYLETIRVVFQEFALVNGTWDVISDDGDLERVRPEDIKATAHFTIEGELDDISGSGQTEAAHALCYNVPKSHQKHLEVRAPATTASSAAAAGVRPCTRKCATSSCSSTTDRGCRSTADARPRWRQHQRRSRAGNGHLPEVNRLAARLHAALPQTQCTRCGYPDCAGYAQAIAAGEAEINQCPPGGAEGIARLAALTGPRRGLNPANGAEGPRTVAVIDEAWCIGCTLCIDACPTDAIWAATSSCTPVIEPYCTAVSCASRFARSIASAWRASPASALDGRPGRKSKRQAPRALPGAYGAPQAREERTDFAGC